MSEPNYALLESLADLCRAKGVRVMHWGDVRIELGPAESPAAPDKKRVDTEACGCGHGLHAHNAGLCLHGCPVEKCAGAEATP